MPRFLLQHGEREVILKPGVWTLGRGPECDVVIDDPAASRQHALLEVTRQRAWLRDEGSRNGIYVNGRRVHGEIEIVRGDVLRVGKTTMSVLRVDTSHDREAVTAPISKLPDPEDAQAALAALSRREREVLALMAQGHSVADIGRKLGISIKTAETYRARLSSKLDLRSRAELVQFAMKSGLVPLP